MDGPEVGCLAFYIDEATKECKLGSLEDMSLKSDSGFKAYTLIDSDSTDGKPIVAGESTNENKSMIVQLSISITFIFRAMMASKVRLNHIVHHITDPCPSTMPTIASEKNSYNELIPARAALIDFNYEGNRPWV